MNIMVNCQVMKNPMSLHIVLAVLFAIGIHTCEEKRFWKVSNTITSACDLWKGAVPHVLTCAQMCRRQDTCVMFRFHVTGSCFTFCDTGSDSGATSEYEDTVYTTNTSGPTASCHGKPPPVGHGSVNYTSLVVNSVAHYRCKNNYFFFGRSNQSVCQENGSWVGFDGSCTSKTLPIHKKFRGEVTAGWKLEIFATPFDVARTTFQLRYQDSYIAFHFDIRFHFEGYTNTVIINKKNKNGWGPRDVITTNFPFAQKQPFNLTVVVDTSGYQVYVDGEFFANRSYYGLNFAVINQVAIKRGASIQFIKIYD